MSAILFSGATTLSLRLGFSLVSCPFLRDLSSGGLLHQFLCVSKEYWVFTLPQVTPY